jgi:kynurenine 3-monooxygenase
MSSEKQNELVAIVGGGLVGSLLAIYMRRRGHHVQLFEKRPDMRSQSIDAGRSINLVVTSRGLNALAEVGILEEVMKITIPVKGRMMHSLQGDLTYSPYGKDDNECNYSVSRGELNKILLDIAEREGAETFFERELLNFDLNSRELSFKTASGETEKISADRVFGTDGAGSVIRKEMKGSLKDFEESIIPLGASYKELYMPSSKNGNYPIEKNALHIWPRGKHMFMALPNLDGSFTMTLYLPDDGDISFQSYKTKEDVSEFFHTYYNDSVSLMPKLVEDYLENPVGRLATVKCSPWSDNKSVALLGDAAHAVVPFFGQGMNAGFEDCMYLNQFLDETGSWEDALRKYSQFQKGNGDAIADMAVENFTVMKEKVADSVFLFRKSVEIELEKRFPEIYRSKYGAVTYTLIPYQLCMEMGEIQKNLLDQLCEKASSLEDIDFEKAEDLIHKQMTPFVEKNNIKIERYVYIPQSRR